MVPGQCLGEHRGMLPGALLLCHHDIPNVVPPLVLRHDEVRDLVAYAVDVPAGPLHGASRHLCGHVLDQVPGGDLPLGEHEHVLEALPVAVVGTEVEAVRLVPYHGVKESEPDLLEVQGLPERGAGLVPGPGLVADHPYDRSAFLDHTEQFLRHVPEVETVAVVRLHAVVRRGGDHHVDGTVGHPRHGRETVLVVDPVEFQCVLRPFGSHLRIGP